MKKIIIISTLILLGSTLFIFNNKKINQEITIEDLENNKSIAIYIKDDNGNYNKATNIPTSGYTLNTTKSVCTNNARPSWNIKTNSLKISNLTNKDTGCYLYFEKYIEPSKKTLDMLGLTATPGLTTGFSNIANTDEGLKSDEDDDGTTYYFRGAVTNNWVQFAGFYWRIIRINGDGSIRLIYNGSTTNQTGEGTQIGQLVFSSTYGHAEYVGLKYTLGVQHGVETNSQILGTIDSTNRKTLNGWYNSNIKGTINEKYIEQNGKFCSDRNAASGHSSYLGTGVGTTLTVFAPADRLLNVNLSSWRTTQNPTFKCSNSNDVLLLPVGLITSDEIIYAGASRGDSNINYYLYTNQYYWTMSPSVFDNNNKMFVLSSHGALDYQNVNLDYGVRPVINLSPDVRIIGDGTTSNPYRIEGVE